MTTPKWATRASARSACSRSRSTTARLRPRVTVVRGDGESGVVVTGLSSTPGGPSSRANSRPLEQDNPVPHSPVPVRLDRSRGVPLGVQLSGQIRDLVLAGTLARGDRLPSTRSLATDLGVARSVTEQAYDQLLAEGWLEGRRGAGTFVASAGRPTSSPSRARHDRPAEAGLV